MTKTQQQTGRTIERELTINASPDDVWKALTDASQIRNWFAPEAEGTGGVGGIIKLRWDEEVTWDMPIRVWEPGNRLVVGDEGDFGTEGSGGLEHRIGRMVIEYALEAAGGGTVLRLIHSGFGESADWENTYNGTCNGWTYELRSLRHYLENHLGKDRTLAWVRRPIAVSKEEGWRRLVGPEGLGIDPDPATLHEGDRFSANMVTGEHLDGTVLSSDPGVIFSGAVDQLNQAVLRADVETWCGKSKDVYAMVFLATWDADEEQAHTFESRWNTVLKNLFAD